MAALVIAWTAGQLFSKKFRQKISKELHKDVYSEIVVVSFGRGEIPLEDISGLGIWDVCAEGKGVGLVQAPGRTWSDSIHMIDSEDVYVCGGNTETQVLGVCLGLRVTHNVRVISDLCYTQSRELNSRALQVVGSTIGFANLVKTSDSRIDVTQG